MRKGMRGLRAWMLQRASAVYMVFFIVFLLAHFAFDPPHSFRAWHEWVSDQGVSISAIGFAAALLAHVWVGLRDVILDYVQPARLRLPVLVLLGLALAGLATWLGCIFWRTMTEANVAGLFHIGRLA